MKITIAVMLEIDDPDKDLSHEEWLQKMQEGAISRVCSISGIFIEVIRA